MKRRDWVLSLVALGLVLASMVRPIHVVENGHRFDCGTSASSPFHYRQYPRLYGRDAGQACQQELDNTFNLEFGIVVLSMASMLVIRLIRHEPPFTASNSA
jgi:hypothetical protein